jgi:hypothetical protein
VRGILLNISTLEVDGFGFDLIWKLMVLEVDGFGSTMMCNGNVGTSSYSFKLTTP